MLNNYYLCHFSISITFYQVIYDIDYDVSMYPRMSWIWNIVFQVFCFKMVCVHGVVGPDGSSTRGLWISGKWYGWQWYISLEEHPNILLEIPTFQQFYMQHFFWKCLFPIKKCVRRHFSQSDVLPCKSYRVMTQETLLVSFSE